MSDTPTRTRKPAGAAAGPPRRRAGPAARVVADRTQTAAAHPTEAEPITFAVGTGNVFEDFGLSDAADEAVKARLVMRLRAEMDRRGLNQTEFARVLGIKQPDVSNLLRGRVLGFSLERMLEFTQALGDDVEITLRPSRSERRGKMLLKVA